MKKIANQKGFTLIELAVVVAVLGILLAMLAPSILGSKDSSNANLLLKTAQDGANSWTLVAQSCGTTTDVVNSPVPATPGAAGAAAVIFGGSANVAAAYQNCYNQAHVRAMADVGQSSGSGYKVGGYTLALSGGGTVPMEFQYAGLPDALVLMMAQKYTPSLSTLAASDSTSPVVQYSAAASGVRTVTVLRQSN